MINPLVFFLNTDGVFLFVLFVLVFLYINKKHREVFWHAFLVFLVTLAVVVILKELFNAPRPFEIANIEKQAGLTWFSSFPSAHAAIAFSVSTIVALHRRRLGIFCLMIASLIALGRVAGGVHYPVDVAFGMLVGVTIALFFDTVHVSKNKLRKKHS